MASTHRLNFIIPLLCGILIARTFVNGAAIPRTLPSYTELVARQQLNGNECGFKGNSDAYGFGIRLGIYLQWISAILSCYMLKDPAVRKELMDTHMLFSTAIFSAMIALTLQDTGLYSIEIIILLYIFYTDAFNSAATLPSMGEIESSTLGLLYSITLSVGMAAYSIWFWFRGVYRFARTPCGSYVFLFARVNIYGRGGTFFRALTVFYAVFLYIYVAIILLRPIVVTIYYISLATYRTLRANHHQRKGDDWGIDLNRGSSHVRGKLNILLSIYILPHRQAMESLQQERPKDKPYARKVNKAMPVISLVWSVIGIELMVHWNRISGVYVLGQTGQLIPLVIGIGGFVKTLYAINNQRWNNSVWHSDYEAFRKPGGPWIRFKKNKTTRRLSVS